jgi:hypothetical protein
MSDNFGTNMNGEQWTALILIWVTGFLCLMYAAAARPFPAIVFGAIGIVLLYALETDAQAGNPNDSY